MASVTWAGFARRFVHASAVSAVILLAQTVSAQNFLANKKFAPTTIGPNAQAVLTFDLFNGSASTLAATLTDKLPTTAPAGQLWYDSTDLPAVTGTGCTTGTWSFTDLISGTRYQTATFTSATVPNQPIPAETSPDCKVSIPVHSGVVSADTNLINMVPGANAVASGTAGSFQSQDFSATLQVRAPVNVNLSKAFSPTSVPAGGLATLTIKVVNPSSAFPLTNVALTDSLPPGLIVSSGPTFSGCGAAVSAGTTTQIAVNSATIAAGGTCTITAVVQAPSGADATLTNTIAAGNVTSSESSTNASPATATLGVVNSITMTKAFRAGTTSRTNDTPAPSGFSNGTTTVQVNQPVLMRVHFYNPTNAALTGGSLTDLLPNNVVPVGSVVTGTCGGSPAMTSAPIGSQTQSTITPITVPAAVLTNPSTTGTCYIEIYVKPTAVFALNTNSISSSNVTFAGGISPTNPTSANLGATTTGGGPGGVGALGVDKRFSRDGTPFDTQTGTGAPLSVQKGERFWMKVSVWNRTYDQGYTGGTVTDTLPLNVKAVLPLNIRLLQNPPSSNSTVNGGCGDGVGGGNIGTVTVTPIAGQDVVTYTGFDVRNGSGANTGAQAGCFYSIQLESLTSGDYINTIAATNVITTEGATNPAAVSARVAVLSDLDASKFFDPSVISQGGKTRLYLRFSNKAATPITGLAVTDPLPSSGAFGTLTVATPANVTTTCGGTVTATPGTTSVSISGGTVPANGGSAATPGLCQVEVDVQQTGGSSTSSTITNTIPVNAISNDQNQSNPLPITASLDTRPMGIAVVKFFDASDAQGGAPVKLTVKVSSTSSPASQWPQDQIALTDNFPAGMVVAPTPGVTTTCRKAGVADGTASPALSATPADVVATPGASSFSISGFRFRGTNAAPISQVPDNECAVEVFVIATTTGNKTNTIPIGAITSASGTSNTSATQATLTALPNTQLLKSFNPTSVSVGQTSVLALQINNVNTSPQTDFGLTDNLPAGMTIVGAASTTCGDGVVTAILGGTSVSITGGDVAANAVCVITVPVLLANSGSYVNNASNITADAVINTTGVTATVVAITPPTVSKAFAPTLIQNGSPSTLTITLNNADTTTALSNVSLTDNLPAGIVVFSTPASSNSCGGTFAPVAANTVLTLTGGGIVAGGSCQLTVQVTGAVPGQYTNTIPAGGLTSDQGNNVNPATAILEIGGPALLSTTKSGSATGVNGGTATYTVTFTNSTSFAVPVAIADPLGAYSAFAWTCSGSNVSCPTAAGVGAIAATLTMPANSTLTYIVNATLPQTGTSVSNTSTIGIAPGNPAYTEAPGELGDNTATATTTMSRSSVLSITKTDGVTQVTAGLTTTYTVVISNAGPSQAVGALARDIPGTGLTLQSVTCSAASNGAMCPVSGVTIANLTGTGIAIDLPATGTMTFSIVALINPGATGNVVNTATVTHPDSNGGVPLPATDTDTILVVPGLQIQKTDGVSTVIAGNTTTYTISVTNGGPSSILGALVKDIPGSGLTLQSVSCGSASGGAVCPASGNVTVLALTGAGISIDLPVSVTPPAAAVPSGMVFTVVAAIDPAQTADVTNTASITQPGGQPITSVDTDTVTQSADVSVTKVALTPQIIAGTPGLFRITVRNIGPSSLTGVMVQDTLPAQMLADLVTCSNVSGGAVCPAVGLVTPAALTGAGISVDLPAGATLSFDVTVHTLVSGTFVNLASVAHPNDSTPGPESNQSTATLLVVVAEVPTLSTWALLALALMMLLLGVSGRATQRRA